MIRALGLAGLLVLALCGVLGIAHGQTIYACPAPRGGSPTFTDTPCPGKSGKVLHQATQQELINNLRGMIIRGDPDAALFAARNGLMDYYSKVTKPNADPELEHAARLWRLKKYREAAEQQAQHQREQQDRIVEQFTEQAYQSHLAAERTSQNIHDNDALLRGLSTPQQAPPPVIVTSPPPLPTQKFCKVTSNNTLFCY